MLIATLPYNIVGYCVLVPFDLGTRDVFQQLFIQAGVVDGIGKVPAGDWLRPRIKGGRRIFKLWIKMSYQSGLRSQVMDPKSDIKQRCISDEFITYSIYAPSDRISISLRSIF